MFAEKDIIDRFTLRLSLKGNHLFFTHNVYLFNGFESDIVSVNPNLMVYEYEIKTSISDFMNEFKNKSRKHKSLQVGKHNNPNYYYFITPKGMIDNNVVNDKYGIIEFDDRLTFKYKTKAKKLHPKKLRTNTLAQITRSLNFKYWKPIHESIL